jgi:hypothetical protein
MQSVPFISPRNNRLRNKQIGTVAKSRLGQRPNYSTTRQMAAPKFPSADQVLLSGEGQQRRFAAWRSFPIYPEEQTMSEAVSMS